MSDPAIKEYPLMPFAPSLEGALLAIAIVGLAALWRGKKEKRHG